MNASGPPVSTLEISTGENVTLVCQSRGYPRPLLSWWLNGRLLTDEEQEVLVVEAIENEAVHLSTRILIHQLSGDTTGNFTCTADNGYGPRLSTSVHVSMPLEGRYTAGICFFVCKARLWLKVFRRASVF